MIELTQILEQVKKKIPISYGEKVKYYFMIENYDKLKEMGLNNVLRGLYEIGEKLNLQKDFSLYNDEDVAKIREFLSFDPNPVVEVVCFTGEDTAKDAYDTLKKLFPEIRYNHSKYYKVTNYDISENDTIGKQIYTFDVPNTDYMIFSWIDYPSSIQDMFITKKK